MWKSTVAATSLHGRIGIIDRMGKRLALLFVLLRTVHPVSLRHDVSAPMTGRIVLGSRWPGNSAVCFSFSMASRTLLKDDFPPYLEHVGAL